MCDDGASRRRGVRAPLSTPAASRPSTRGPRADLRALDADLRFSAPDNAARNLDDSSMIRPIYNVTVNVPDSAALRAAARATPTPPPPPSTKGCRGSQRGAPARTSARFASIFAILGLQERSENVNQSGKKAYLQGRRRRAHTSSKSVGTRSQHVETNLRREREQLSEREGERLEAHRDSGLWRLGNDGGGRALSTARAGGSRRRRSGDEGGNEERTAGEPVYVGGAKAPAAIRVG